MGNPYSSLASVSTELSQEMNTKKMDENNTINHIREKLFILLRAEYEESSKFFTCLQTKPLNIQALKQDISQHITIENIQNPPPIKYNIINNRTSLYTATLDENQQKIFILLQSLPWVENWLKMYDSFCNDDDDDDNNV